MDTLDALAAPLLRAAPPDAALRRRVEEEASAFCRDLEAARRAREALLLAHPELTRPPTAAEAAEDAWVARLTEELRGVLRASVAEHWPDAPVAAAPGKDRVPRMALELARGVAAAVDQQHELAGLADATKDLLREHDALLALGLGPAQALVSPGAFVQALEERIIALRDEGRAAKRKLS